ncbi:type IV pilin-like G/H family protein [Spirulina sp. CCNP1310]|uniref:type IV pilin-like G/H family protein n=1 Tax=Spirulina sp. CCNP1310 TaxID=3110249 RepID=UPI002B220B34|nr:type IV pilin-like G/H family protein [Spirulina sp. CCNP1310]MEA5417873.1 type IV pilin-like G/H family protein [Spirulina sp. CCNP1310]
MNLTRITPLALLASLALGTTACNQAGTKWQGTWEFENPDTGETVQFILSDDQKVFFLGPEGLTPEPVAYEIPIKRVSEATTVPEGVEIVDLAAEIEKNAAQAISSEGALSISALMRGQQAYHLEKGEFTDDFEKIGIGLPPETDNYNYKMTLAENRIGLTATAKVDKAKSYAGLVYIEGEGPQSMTRAILCTTEADSTTAPDLPEVAEGEATCASGSVPVE